MKGGEGLDRRDFFREKSMMCDDGGAAVSIGCADGGSCRRRRGECSQPRFRIFPGCSVTCCTRHCGCDRRYSYQISCPTISIRTLAFNRLAVGKTREKTSLS